MVDSARLGDAMPEFAQELFCLLQNLGRADLAVQAPTLLLLRGCDCKDPFCSSFHTAPPTEERQEIESIHLASEAGLVIVDVCNGRIVYVESLYRPDVKAKISQIFPKLEDDRPKDEPDPLRTAP